MKFALIRLGNENNPHKFIFVAPLLQIQLERENLFFFKLLLNSIFGPGEKKATVKEKSINK